MSNLSDFLGGSIFTNTRNYLLPRVQTETSVTSPLSWNSDQYETYIITAQSTSFTISADSGSPIDGQKMLFRIKDNGTSRTITFTGGVSKGFRPVGTTFSVTGSDYTYSTTISKNTYFGCVYNSLDSRWDIIAVSQEV